MAELNSNGSLGDLPEDIQRWTAKRRAVKGHPDSRS